tara:strand:+ start:1876 stop:2193 length:318 start_codon:yes stop_codon:yes gene_type:complete
MGIFSIFTPLPSHNHAAKEAQILAQTVRPVTETVSSPPPSKPVSKDAPKHNWYVDEDGVMHENNDQVQQTQTAHYTSHFSLDRYTLLYAGLATFLAMEAYQLLRN